MVVWLALLGGQHGNTEINVLAGAMRLWRADSRCGGRDFLAVLPGKALGLHEPVHDRGASYEANHQAQGVASNHFSNSWSTCGG